MDWDERDAGVRAGSSGDFRSIRQRMVLQESRQKSGKNKETKMRHVVEFNSFFDIGSSIKKFSFFPRSSGLCSMFSSMYGTRRESEQFCM